MTKEIVLKETSAAYAPATAPTVESILDEIRKMKEPLLLVQGDKPVAAVIPISDYQQFALWREKEEQSRTAASEKPESVLTWQEQQERILSKEIAAFEQMKPELLKTHNGKWVAVLDGQLVESDDNRQLLSQRVREKFGDRTMLIEQVRDAPRIYVADSPERVSA